MLHFQSGTCAFDFSSGNYVRSPTDRQLAYISLLSVSHRHSFTRKYHPRTCPLPPNLARGKHRGKRCPFLCNFPRNLNPFVGGCFQEIVHAFWNLFRHRNLQFFFSYLYLFQHLEKQIFRRVFSRPLWSFCQDCFFATAVEVCSKKPTWIMTSDTVSPNVFQPFFLFLSPSILLYKIFSPVQDRKDGWDNKEASLRGESDPS